MRARKLRRKVRNQARREYRRGNITREAYGHAIAVSNNNQALAELQSRIDSAGLDPWKNPERLYGADWGAFFRNIWDWFVENWPTILEMILTIAPLFLLEPEYEDR